MLEIKQDKADMVEETLIATVILKMNGDNDIEDKTLTHSAVHFNNSTVTKVYLNNNLPSK